VIVNPLEFNTTYFDIFDKLKQSPEYLRLFAEAFPGHSSQPISVFTFSKALSAYVSSLAGWNSPFDRYARGESEALSEPARRGFNLFMGKAACGTCHFAPVFNGTVPPEYSDSESEVLGVPAGPAKRGATVDPDPGRWANGRMVERVEFYRYSFKTPSVRNAALTAPYMHNGVYETLEEVMDFYNIGGGEGLGLGLEYQTLPPDPLGLSKREIRDIIAFMESLSDTAGLTAKPARLPAFPEGSPYNERADSGAY
jgi:cytochrome c peroxidase